MKKAGFVLEVSEDLADRNDELPWYWPLSGDLRYTQSLWDLPTLIRMTHVGRGLAHGIVGALEMIGVAPKGSRKTADSLAEGADCLVAGGKEKLFTPMYSDVTKIFGPLAPLTATPPSICPTAYPIRAARIHAKPARVAMGLLFHARFPT